MCAKTELKDGRIYDCRCQHCYINNDFCLVNEHLPNAIFLECYFLHIINFANCLSVWNFGNQVAHQFMIKEDIKRHLKQHGKYLELPSVLGLPLHFRDF